MVALREQAFRVPEVCRRVGISYRQLDYWDRTGLVSPSLRGAAGSGSGRRYSWQDVQRLRAVRRLLDAGVSLQAVRRCLADPGAVETTVRKIREAVALLTEAVPA